MGDLLVPGGLFVLLMFLGGDEAPKQPGRIGLPDGPVGPGGTEPTRPTTPGRIDPPPKVPPDLPSILDPYPTSGGAYQIVQGDMLLGNTQQGGIAHRAIAQDVFLLGQQRGMTNQAALQLASTIAAKARARYVSEIQGDWFNDRQYGTYGYGPNAMPSSITGRALRLLPIHADNRARMINGEQPIRSIKLSTPNNKGQGTGTKAPGAPGGNLELIVLPPYDVAKLVDLDVLQVDRNWHPKWLRDLGWIDMSNAPASTKWGA